MKYPPGKSQADILFINVFIGDEMRPREEVQPETAQSKAQRRGESVGRLQVCSQNAADDLGMMPFKPGKNAGIKGFHDKGTRIAL